MTPEDNLDEYQHPADYDAENGAAHAPALRFYLQLAEAHGGPILDLACGTGLLTLPLADAGHAVTGVDLAVPMVDYARTKPGAERVQWHVADARTLELDMSFRLILLTGNAFQAFLTQADQEAMLKTVVRHLGADVRFAFETRNPHVEELDAPSIEEPWHTFTDSTGQQVTVSGFQRYDPVTEIAHYTTFRRWTDSGRVRTTEIALRFSSAQAIESLLRDCGLRVLNAYGSWDLRPLEPLSPRMIFVCGRD